MSELKKRKRGRPRKHTVEEALTAQQKKYAQANKSIYICPVTWPNFCTIVLL